MPRPKTCCLLTLALALIVLPAARAQTTDLAQRLPADTLFYLYWHGAGSIAAGNSNALVSLWNDPGFEPARRIILQGFVDAASRNPRLAQIPDSEWQALLADPIVFGIRLAGQGKSAKTEPNASAHGFLVVQATGKAGDELRATLTGGGRGVSPNVRFISSGLLLASSDPATLEELARQFGASPASNSESLSSLPAYRQARAEVGGQPPVEFFLRVPAATALGAQKRPGFNTQAFLESLHLERVRALCGSIDLNGPDALARFAWLGNTSPGSLFDLFGGNAASFSTLAAAPAGASILVSRFDIGAVLSLLTNAFSAAMGPEQAARLEIMSGVFSSMVAPALGGEYATIWPQTGEPNPAPLVVLTVNEGAADRLFSTTFAQFVQPAGQDGQIRYYRLAGRSRQGEPGQGGAASQSSAGLKSALLALTPNMLLAGRDDALVRSSARAVTSATGPAGLAATDSFRAARAELPAELSGLGYFDLQAFDWTNWIERVAGGMGKNKNPRARERAAELENWAKSGGGAVLAKHLHLVTAGAWKDDQGMHWRGEIH